MISIKNSKEKLVDLFLQEEALNIVRDTNTRKKDIIRKVFKMLESYNSDYILF